VNLRLRLLILGANGFVGGWLARLAPAWFDVVGPGARIDVTDPTACLAGIGPLRPNVVALLAAVSDIDRCERDPALAESVNVGGAGNVARACREAGAHLLFASSGAIFDGTKSAYTEDDPPCPVSVYGRTKAQGEQAIVAILPDSVIVRFSLVLGMAMTPGTNAVTNRLVAAWQQGRTVLLPADEYRNALDVQTVAALFLELARNPQAKGVYHVGSANALSRFEIGRTLADVLGYASSLVAPQIEPPQGRAPRGRYEFLRPDKIAGICRTAIPTCQSAIRRSAHAIAQSRP